MSSNKTFDKNFWIVAFITILIISIICHFPLWFTTEGGEIDFTDTGQIGDTIGGIMGPFVAIIAALLTFMAFWVQFKANQEQRSDISLERFENNLFQMIALQEEITDNLYYSPNDGADEAFGEVFRGRSIFEQIYEYRLWHDDMNLKKLIEKKGFSYFSNDKNLSMFDHYFRHLYRIFKYIDEAKVIEDNIYKQYEYSAIVRSMLSEYELVFLYYNSLNANGNVKFKNLIEKYAILNNLRFEKLATLEERNYYQLLLYREGNTSTAIPEETYAKSAFEFKFS